jgi:hypothetical protein
VNSNHGLGSVKVKESGEGRGDAQGEQDSADVIAQAVARLDGLGMHVNVCQFMLAHGFSLVK